MASVRNAIGTATLAMTLVVGFGGSNAGATLVFTRNPLHPAVFAASDNGKGVRRIGAGSSPHISPNDDSIVYLRGGKSPEMELVPTAGGSARMLMKGWREPFDFAFSPDSKLVAAERGHELGKRKLVVIDLASGKQQVLASGYFSGFSFSPDGGELAFSKLTRAFSESGDIFRVKLSGGEPVALTDDHRSTEPLWGPQNKIVFDKAHNLKSRLSPKAQLYLMDPDGGGVKQLTHTKVPPLIFGLTPVAWSASGGQLLAEYGGEDTTYAVTVDPRSGAERKVIPGDTEMGFDGTALSKNGKFVLGVTSVEPGPHQHIAVVPYGGGKKMIVTKGYEPSWSR
ncbi:MAG: TolB family protein [Solirubrobacterales bacterium]